MMMVSDFMNFIKALNIDRLFRIELSGLPEYLVIAVRGDQSQGLSVEKEFSTVDVKVECVIDSDDRDENFLAKTNDQTLKNIELESR